MKRAPIFTDPHGNRWSMHSDVVAREWIRDEDGGAKERVETGQVVRLFEDENQERGRGWFAELSFGPMLDLVTPLPLRTFPVEQIEALV
jgi:hypothetical protein